MSDNSITIDNQPANPVPVAVQNFPSGGGGPSGSLSSVVTRQAINATPNVVLSANPSRKKLFIAVEGCVPLYVLYANTVALASQVSATNYTRMIENSDDDINDVVWCGCVGVVNPTNQGGSIQITELS